MKTMFEIVSSSFKHASKHKILWIFALLTVLSNYNYPSSTKIDDPKELQQDVLGVISPEIISEYNDANVNVLAISPPTDNFKLADSLAAGLVYSRVNSHEINSYVNELIAASPFYLVLLAITLVVFVLFSLFVFFFTVSWATGALLSGVEKVLHNKPFSMHSLATLGRKYIRELFKFYILQSIVFIGLLLFFVGLIINYKEHVIAYTLATFPLFLVFIFLYLVGTFAFRYIVFKNLSYKRAALSSIKLISSNPVKVFIFLVVHVFLVLVVSSIIYALEKLYVGAPEVSVILFIPVTLFITTTTAYLATFQAFYYTNCFNLLTKGDNNL